MLGVKETLWSANSWFYVEYIIHEYHIEFKAYKIDSLDEEDIKESTFNATEPTIEGVIKWDGCCDFKQIDHYCDIEHAKQFLLFMKELYDYQDNVFNK